MQTDLRHKTLTSQLRKKIQETSETGISLTTIATQGDLKTLEFAAMACWLHTCGFPPYTTPNIAYHSPALGFAPWLHKNPDFYTMAEKDYKNTLLKMAEPPENQPGKRKLFAQKAAKLEWLNPEKPTVHAIILKTSKTIIFSGKITPTEGSILIEDRKLPRQPPSTQTSLSLGPKHPLTLLITGYDPAPNMGINLKDIQEIKKTNGNMWQISTKSALWHIITKCTQ
jgi:hypothetical protein